MSLTVSTPLIQAGYVSGRTEFAFALSNSGESPVTVTEVEIPEDWFNQGLAIVGQQPPFEIAADSSVAFAIAVQRIGKVSFSGQWVFRTESDSASVSISGERRVPFGVRPNWAKPVVVRYSFKTSIAQSRGGVEKRVGVRHQPRRTVDMTLLEADDEFRLFKDVLSEASSLPLLVKDPTRHTTLQAQSVGAGISVPSGTPWATEGRFVFVGDEVARVYSVDGGDLVLEDTLGEVYPSGTRVTPALYSRLNDEIELTNHASYVAGSDITLHEIPGHAGIELSGAAEMSFDGREVFPFEINWRRGVQSTFASSRQTVDTGFGVDSVSDPARFNQQVRRADLRLLGGDIERAIAFFHRVRGRQVGFWCSTGVSDMTLAAGQEVAGEDQVRVAGDRLYRFFKDNEAYKAICAVTPGGLERFLIETMTLDGENTVLSLSTPWSAAPPTWSKLSWLLPSRLGSDDLALTFHAKQAATTALSVQTIKRF